MHKTLYFLDIIYIISFIVYTIKLFFMKDSDNSDRVKQAGGIIIIIWIFKDGLRCVFEVISFFKVVLKGFLVNVAAFKQSDFTVFIFVVCLVQNSSI